MARPRRTCPAHLRWECAAAGVARIERMRRPPARNGCIACVRRHRIDQLFTATEVNEWALCAALLERDPARWAQRHRGAARGLPRGRRDPADVIPPVLEESAALARLQLRSASERRPDVRALLEAAARTWRALRAGRQNLTLGAGAGGQSWPLDALPRSRTVPWQSLRAIPVAVVTGSNGKTTTVRLIAACARAHGWRDGFNCTDGVFIGRELSATGDYSGPAGTRRVLRDPRVEAAVLETARGGILRRGLALDHADVAIVTNISPDHFGEYGIDDLDGLADVKLSVAHLVRRDGLLVLNADDALLTDEKPRAARAPGLATTRSAGLRCDYDSPSLAHAARSPARRPAACARAPDAAARPPAPSTTSARSRDMPLTVAAARQPTTSRISRAPRWPRPRWASQPRTIAAVFASFGSDLADNAGRLMRSRSAACSVVLDYAHNPDGVARRAARRAATAQRRMDASACCSAMPATG